MRPETGDITHEWVSPGTRNTNGTSQRDHQRYQRPNEDKADGMGEKEPWS
jgi:hypothetical protein